MVVLGLYAFTPMAANALPVNLPAPSNLTATATATSVTLKWTNNYNLVNANDKIYIDKKYPVYGWFFINTPPADTTIYYDYDVEAGKTYSYRIRVWTTTGISDFSNEVIITIPYPPGPPSITAQPQNQTITVGQTATFSITASNPMIYQWQSKQLASSTWTNVTDDGVHSGAQTPTLKITPVDRTLSGRQYRCSVGNTDGSTSSNGATLSVNAAPVAAPSNLTATAEAGGIVLKWNDNSNNETGFIIERQDGGSGWGQMAPVAANATTYKDTNVQDGQTYSYRVNATGPSSVVSGYSNEVTATMASMFAVTVNSGTGSGNYSAGQNVAIKANTPPAGKVFDKWTTSSSGVTFTSAANANTAFTMPSNAVTVTATYKDKDAAMYKVTMKYNNGEPDWVQEVKEGDKADPGMEDPIKAGFEFAGWYKDAQFKNKYNFNVPVTAHITLYAKWTGAGESATEPDDGIDTAGDEGTPGDGIDTAGDEGTPDDETDISEGDNGRTPGSAILSGSNGGIDRMLILFIVLVAVAAGAVVTFLIIRKKDKG